MLGKKYHDQFFWLVIIISFDSVKVKKFSPNSELKIKTYEIFRPYFDRTSSVNDMNVKKDEF